MAVHNFSAPDVVVGWQDIASCPRGKKVRFLDSATGSTTEGFWIGPEHEYLAGDIAIKPTHWQEL